MSRTVVSDAVPRAEPIVHVDTHTVSHFGSLVMRMRMRMSRRDRVGSGARRSLHWHPMDHSHRLCCCVLAKLVTPGSGHLSACGGGGRVNHQIPPSIPKPGNPFIAIPPKKICRAKKRGEHLCRFRQ